MPDVLHGVSRPGKQVPASDIAAYAPPVKVEPAPASKGIVVDPDDIQAFARPAAPQGTMPAPVLRLGGNCQHPYATRWVDPQTDVEGCARCAKVHTRDGWVPNHQEWLAAAAAAGVIR